MRPTTSSSRVLLPVLNVLSLAAICGTPPAQQSGTPGTKTKPKKISAEPAVFSNGAVTGTTGPRAQRIGLEILKRGGTAADAGVAVAMAQTVLAAGSWVSFAGIMTVVYYEAETGKVHNMNAAYDTVAGETDPASIPRYDFESGARKPPEVSGRTVLVPGFFKGAASLVERFGKLELREVVAPSIELAEHGFPWHRSLDWQLRNKQEVLFRDPTTKAVFTKPDGEKYAVGDTFRQPALAKTLRGFAEEGDDYVYRGAFAEKLVRAVRALGGKLAMDDLETYEVIYSEPVRGTYRGNEVVAHGIPAAGGVNLVEALRLSEHAGVCELPHYSRSGEALSRLSRVMRPALLLTYRPEAIGKRLGTDLSLPARVDPKTSEKVYRAMQAGRFPWIDKPRRKTAPGSHSDAVVVVDRWGNVLSMVHSINTISWGSTGLFVDGVSIPDSGAIQVDAVARTKPGERLMDPTNPGLVLRDGKPVLGFASIGSGLHERTLAALVSVLGFGMTPKEAIAAPAFGYAPAGQPQHIAKGDFDAEVLAEAEEFGLRVTESNSTRGYWIGIGIDPSTGRLIGGGPRHLRADIRGTVVGY